MLTMDQINHIKEIRNEKGLSINQIAKSEGINWRTAKKYADTDILPKERRRTKSGMMYEDGWNEIIDGWLFEDSRETRKNRRTRKALFEQLKKLGFSGSYRTVCQYIQNTQKEAAKADAFEKLDHPAGEAQLDFGTYRVAYKNELRIIKLLVLAYPYSNRAFAVALPRENRECFLNGLKHLFELSGGVPTEIRIDNLAAAVIKPKKGNKDTVFSDEFEQFRAYYRFNAVACNAYSGHEKGAVENKVGYIRYNFFDEIPRMESFEQLTEWLDQRLAEDSIRNHYQKHLTISELWDSESASLLRLPIESYPVFSYREGKTNKYGELTIDGEAIHIPKAGRNSHLLVKVTWNNFTCVNANGEIVHEGYRPYMNESTPVDWQQKFADWQIKPRALKHSRYTKLLPGNIKLYLMDPDLSTVRARLRQIHGLLDHYTLEEVQERFEKLVLANLGVTENQSQFDMARYDQLSPKAVQQS
ncbi:IS21 family transposase [Jeotgalibaca caeni]|uniref:IS21 family transposase n=1 Tax=Jeotgalibaca caeni TaxID=3028623 RepID=UPI00237DABDB|nr:IS21 family transposase [Jeotgalibaca caeni]MDE1549491.1 IS21 family transposase [Jeotgalibaca caeni]